MLRRLRNLQKRKKIFMALKKILSLLGLLKLMPFVSVENLKNYLGKSTNDQDALLELLIDGVSAHIESYVGEHISETKVTEFFNTVHYDTLTLKHRIIEVISATEATAVVDPTFMEIIGHKTVRRLIAAPPSNTIKWLNGTTINYRAGNIEIPKDIEFATMVQSAYEYKQSVPGGDRLGLFTSSPDTLGDAVTYDIKPLVPQVQQILDLYRAPSL
jgi:hypothetical protein